MSSGLPPSADGLYCIMPACAPQQQITVNGSKVEINSQATWSPAYQWKIEPVVHAGQNCVRIVNASTQLALDVADDNNVNGARLIQHPFHGGHNQLFFVTRNYDGSYTIKPLSSRTRVLDIPYGKNDPETPVEIYDYHGGLNQRFILRAPSRRFE